MAKLTIFRFRGHVSREERFRQLFVEIYPRLVRYAIQLMGDREEAKDIVGEVMEEAWKCLIDWKQKRRMLISIQLHVIRA